MNIGEKIKYLRCKSGLTQEELALSAQTTKQTIHKYETGIISNIPASKIKAIADKLNTTPSYLMGWEEEKEHTAPKGDMPDIFSKYILLNKEDRQSVDFMIESLLQKDIYKNKKANVG